VAQALINNVKYSVAELRVMKKIHGKHVSNHYFHYLCNRYHSRSRRVEAFRGVLRRFSLPRQGEQGKWDIVVSRHNIKAFT
uniref:hypothetical protein n=1 Tax=Prevotella sp. TaxID=59823 RepID=UPI003FF051D9